MTSASRSVAFKLSPHGRAKLPLMVIGTYIALGMMFGMLLGEMFFDSMAAGLAVGLAIEAGLGSWQARRSR